jgi:WD40 repeat protein
MTTRILRKNLSVAWSPDGKRLATGATTATVWDADSGKKMLTLTDSGPVKTVAWSPDGRRLATGGTDTIGKVWDSRTGKELLLLSGHKDSITSMVWSPDGKRLATGSGEEHLFPPVSASPILGRTSAARSIST